MDVGQSLVVRSKNDPTHRFNPYQRVTSQTRVVSSPSLVRFCKEEPKTTFEGTHGFYNDPPRPLDGISPPMTKSTDTNLPHLSKNPVSIQNHLYGATPRVLTNTSIVLSVGTCHES